jgi:hypothetical protein
MKIWNVEAHSYIPKIYSFHADYMSIILDLLYIILGYVSTIRVIMNAKTRDPCRDLFKNLKILPMYSQYIYIH